MADEQTPKPPIETVVPPLPGAPAVALPTGTAPAASLQMPWHKRL